MNREADNQVELPEGWNTLDGRQFDETRCRECERLRAAVERLKAERNALLAVVLIVRGYCQRTIASREPVWPSSLIDALAALDAARKAGEEPLRHTGKHCGHKSGFGPCYQEDGDMCLDDDGFCVGCGRKPGAKIGEERG